MTKKPRTITLSPLRVMLLSIMVNEPKEDKIKSSKPRDS